MGEKRANKTKAKPARAKAGVKSKARPASAKATARRRKKKSALEADIALFGPSLTEMAVFSKNLSVMLKAGMTLNEALSTARDSLKGKFKNVLTKVVEDIEGGIPFSKSLAKHPKIFPDVFINVARAGESSGTLPENLENVAKQLKKDRELVSKVRGAMIYPIIIMAAALFLGLGISFFVLPQIVPLFAGLGVELPVTTRALIAFSEVVENHGLILFISIVAFIGAIFWFVRQQFSKPITHWLLIKLPIIKSIVHNANLARFSSTLGTSLKSGISIDESLDIAKRSIGNYYYGQALGRVSKKIRSGAKLSGELAKSPKLFPSMLVKMLAVGEESGKTEDTLLYLSDFYEEEVNGALKTFTTILEPLLLLFIGSIVGLLALSIISPIYNITGNVSG